MVVGGDRGAGPRQPRRAACSAPGDFWRAYPLVAYLARLCRPAGGDGGDLGALGRGFDRERMRAAAWLLILLLGAALSLALPGATIFFLIAPALALAGIALDERSPQPLVARRAAILVQFLMFAELLALIEMLLIDGPLWAVAPLAALAALPALIEIEADAAAARAARCCARRALGLWIAALVVPRASAERPLGFSIDYFRDADRKTANWGVATKQAPLPAGFPGQWRKGVLPYNGRTRWISPAPLLDTPVADARAGCRANRRRRAPRPDRCCRPGGGDAVAHPLSRRTKLLALGLPGAHRCRSRRKASRTRRCCAARAAPATGW